MNRRWLLFGLIWSGSACRSSLPVPDLAGLYDRAAQYHDTLRRPVVLIPGILGSRLIQSDTERTVWGAFEGGFANPARDDGARLFALPMQRGLELADLRDDVRSDGVLRQVRLRIFGLPLQLESYLQILSTLGVGGYRDEELGLNAVDYGDEHFTCFQFHYDWRRDVAENAAALGTFLREREEYVLAEEQRRGIVRDEPLRFDVVAHSMGGLVLRYFLCHGEQPLDALTPGAPPSWEGAKKIERAILVATPNAGSLDALESLVEGRDFGLFVPKYSAALLGTFPSLYQLLPRPEHGALEDANGSVRRDFLEPKFWIEHQWGLLDPEQDDVLQRLLPECRSREERLQVACDHVEKCLRAASQLFAALDAPGPPPPGTDLILFAGDAEKTPRTWRIAEDGRSLGLLRTDSGDGTVLRASALFDPRLDPSAQWNPRAHSPLHWRQVYFLFRDHLGLTKDPVFTDNILYLLLEDPRTAIMNSNLP